MKSIFLCFAILNTCIASNYFSKQNESGNNVFFPCGSALSRLSKITFISLSPKILDGLKTNLGKYGEVQEGKVVQETKEGIEIQNPNSDATLLFQVDKVVSTDGTSSPMFQASLNLETSATVVKNGKNCNAIIWAGQCFFPECSDPKASSESVQKSFSRLMEEFMNSYTEINPTKPTFLLLK